MCEEMGFYKGLMFCITDVIMTSQYHIWYTIVNFLKANFGIYASAKYYKHWLMIADFIRICLFYQLCFSLCDFNLNRRKRVSKLIPYFPRRV